jgi:hypothetical protein
MASAREVDAARRAAQLALLNAIQEKVSDAQPALQLLQLAEAFAWTVAPEHAHGVLAATDGQARPAA